MQVERSSAQHGWSMIQLELPFREKKISHQKDAVVGLVSGAVFSLRPRSMSNLAIFDLIGQSCLLQKEPSLGAARKPSLPTSTFLARYKCT